MPRANAVVIMRAASSSGINRGAPPSCGKPYGRPSAAVPTTMRSRSRTTKNQLNRLSECHRVDRVTIDRKSQDFHSFGVSVQRAIDVGIGVRERNELTSREQHTMSQHFLLEERFELQR